VCDDKHILHVAVLVTMVMMPLIHRS